jgi:hypothetical protein
MGNYFAPDATEKKKISDELIFNSILTISDMYCVEKVSYPLFVQARWFFPSE